MNLDSLFPKKQKAKKALELVEAYKAIFLSEAGQIVLADLAGKCQMLTPVTDAAGSVVSAFYDGKRAAFLDILKMTACDETRLIKLLQLAERKMNE